MEIVLIEKLMSLMQWLTVGRSFSDAQEKPSRYRMTSLNLVPKFGVENRKTSVGTTAAMKLQEPEIEQALLLSETEQGSLPRPDHMLTPLAPVPEELTYPQGAQKEPIIAEEPSTDASPRPARLRPKSRWSLIKNPWKRSKDAPVKKAHQGELTLDAVKPICNNLCDSDLEFVLQSPPPPQPTMESQGPTGLGFGIWRRWTAKLFRRQTL